MLIIVRHGRSLSNAGIHRTTGKNISDDNNILTSVGLEGALQAGRTIKSITGGEVAQIVSSDLPRAKQTAYTIASALENVVPIILEPKFKEIQWCRDGVYRDFTSARGALEKDIHYRPLEDSENQMEVYTRACAGLLDHAEKWVDGNNILVSHYMVIRALLAIKDSNDPLHMPNYSPKNTDPIIITRAGIEAILRNAETHLKENV